MFNHHALLVESCWWAMLVLRPALRVLSHFLPAFWANFLCIFHIQFWYNFPQNQAKLWAPRTAGSQSMTLCLLLHAPVVSCPSLWGRSRWSICSSYGLRTVLTPLVGLFAWYKPGLRRHSCPKFLHWMVSQTSFCACSRVANAAVRVYLPPFSSSRCLLQLCGLLWVCSGLLAWGGVVCSVLPFLKQISFLYNLENCTWFYFLTYVWLWYRFLSS